MFILDIRTKMYMPGGGVGGGVHFTFIFQQDVTKKVYLRFINNAFYII